ncbi:hypothetical protein NMY22_g10712 [Coprinellus aureogranulatus]|nr:hypothetical protein NMY22_g10712 [Coprinellus aureogranulatus]
MGRRAKYFTREERLVARRAQRARRDARPEAKERRKKQNRRAWRRKRERERLHDEPPAVPRVVRQNSAMKMSDSENKHIFDEFRQGRENIQIGELEIEWEDFNMLIGAPPYPSRVTLNPDFAMAWPTLRSALHGIMAYRYHNYCNDLIQRCKRPNSTPGHIRAILESTYKDLVLEYNRIAAAAQQCFHEGDRVGVSIANQNTIWVSRVMIYTVDDMVTVREGCGTLVRTLADRVYEISRGENV